MVAGILGVCFFLIHQYYDNFRTASFYERQHDRARFIANAYFDASTSHYNFIEAMGEFATSLSAISRVSIYNDSLKLLYSVGDSIAIEKQNVSNLQIKRSLELVENDTQIVYLYYPKFGRVHYVIAKSHDKVGINKSVYLRNILWLIWSLSILLSILAGLWFSNIVLKPINDIVKKVTTITAQNLHQRVLQRNNKDEIDALAFTFNEMLNRLEASFAIQKDFVSNASHEFRTPLTVMKGQIQVALLKPRNENEYIRLLQSLNDDINNLIDLLNALQELAKANADFPAQSFKKTSVLDTLVDAQNNLMKTKRKYRIQVKVENPISDNENYVCMGDYNLLKSAFNNLFDNGCKFSPTNSVEVTLSSKQNNIIVSIKDEGVGISSEAIKHIFEPFYRSNDTRHIYGHGIGLSLCKRIIDWHEGNITVQSKPGVGTTFVVSIPIA
jgi:signal transduction histidine kinase